MLDRCSCRVALDLLLIEWLLRRSSDIDSSEWNVPSRVDDGTLWMILALGCYPKGGCLGQVYDPTLGT